MYRFITSTSISKAFRSWSGSKATKLQWSRLMSSQITENDATFDVWVKAFNGWEIPNTNLSEMGSRVNDYSLTNKILGGVKGGCKEKGMLQMRQGWREQAALFSTEANATQEVKEKKKPIAEPPPVHKKDFLPDVVYLYQFSRTPQIPSFSPYCLKVETWLKLNGIKYENIDTKGRLRSRRGLLPFVEVNGEEINDSDYIITSLSRKYAKNIDHGLSKEQKNIQHAMIRMVENHLQWTIQYWKTSDVDNMVKGYKLNLQTLTGSQLPSGFLAFAFKHTMLKQGMQKAKAAGMAGYSDVEVFTKGKKDIKVLSDMLGEKEFFFGDEPRSLDLIAFVHIAGVLAVSGDVTCPLRDYVKTDAQNLVGLFNRVKDRAWGEDWDNSIGEKLDLNPQISKNDGKEESKS